MNGVALVAPLPRPNQGAVWKEITAQKLRGFQPLARSMDKRRAAPVVRGRDAPKICKQIASRPSGFGSYPARPLILDLATLDVTTRKRCAIQEVPK